MSLLPSTLPTAPVLLLSQGFPTALATNADAPTTPIATVWCPENYGGFPGDYQTYASVIAADATATTYKLDCAVGGKSPSLGGCGAWPWVTFTVGPSTAEIVASNGGEYHG